MPLTTIKSVLVDTNVWLDYFMSEGPQLDEICGLVAAAHHSKLTLLYAPTSAKDLFYLIPRRLRRTEGREGISYRPAAWACLRRLMEIATAAPLSFPECELARTLGKTFSDFEDNLILAAAETAKADYVVTQDRAFLASAPEVCVTPARAMELLGISFGDE